MSYLWDSFMLLCESKVNSFLLLSRIPWYDYIKIYLFAFTGHLSSFQSLTIVNIAQRTFGYKFWCGYVFSFLSRHGMTRSYGRYVFNFKRYYPNVFQSGCTILKCHQQSIRFPVVWHPFQNLVLNFPGGTEDNQPANAGDTGFNPGLGRSHMLRSS